MRKSWHWLLGLVLLCGCRGDSRPANERFIPDEAQAQQALSLVMDCWKSGIPVTGPLAGHDILVVDAWQRDGRLIDDYRILGPQPWDRGRRFVVELALRDEPEPVKTRYVVVGIEPLIVFRQEDFDLLANWMHPMTEQSNDPAPASDQALAGSAQRSSDSSAGPESPAALEADSPAGDTPDPASTEHRP